MKFGREVAVLGVGMTPFGKFPDKIPQQLGAEAARAALKDANLVWKDIQGLISGFSLFTGSVGMLPGNALVQYMGETGIPCVNIVNACATGGASIAMARNMVASGERDIVMAMGFDMCPKGFYQQAVKPMVQVEEYTYDSQYLTLTNVGCSNPGYWALYARERMEKYGSTKEDLALAKVAASKHGQYNPYSRYKKVYTVEEVLASPVVCDPLRLFMICATSDGAAAAIFCSVEEAKKRTAKPVILSGVGVGSRVFGDPVITIGTIANPSVPAETPDLSESVMACKMAYDEAGVGPEDIDFVELPDNSSWHYFAYMEAEGLCKPGEAEQLVRAGETTIGGKIPVNPSGGPSSMGEAFPALGIAQLCEITWQLRGECDQRQVEGAKVALGQTYGSNGSNAVVILKN